MGRSRSKSDLPAKICPVCQRPFTWRKKWADCWDDVKYCSVSCRRRKRKANSLSKAAQPVVIDGDKSQRRPFYADNN